MSRGRKPVVQCTAGEWREMTNQLRACCPAPENYSWRFIWCREIDGGTSSGECDVKSPKDGKRGRMMIKVVKGLSRVETLDTLIHEMAHAYDTMTAPHNGWAGAHSDTFWIWVGRIYRRWHGEE